MNEIEIIDLHPCYIQSVNSNSRSKYTSKINNFMEELDNDSLINEKSIINSSPSYFISDTIMSPKFMVKERKQYNTNRNGILMTFVIICTLCILAILYRVYQYYIFKEWTIFLYLLLIPIVFLLAFSFLNYLVFGLKNLILSSDMCKHNSTYYSCFKSKPPNKLPHVTIQMPIYKESFEITIVPSIKSLKIAMEFYMKCGGYVNLYINDDGFAFLSKDEQLKRIQYYNDNNIGWTSRDILNRNGIFKKGSNMNSAIKFSKEYMSNLMETTLEDSVKAVEMTNKYYKNANINLIGGNDVSIGEFILLVDSDTTVPERCIYNTVGEFYGNDNINIAFTQHLTTPLIEEKDKNDNWTLLICHFTKMIYELAFIQVTVGGNPAPLIGHNAFIRFSHLEEVKIDENTWWNENTVCEDFDLSLRFQSKGHYGRYITYTGVEFMEGVSPTYCDEIVRFKKYAFGTAELSFNPFGKWISDGIFSDTLKMYLKNKMIPWYSKILLLSYMCSYYTMAFSPLTLLVNAIEMRFCNDCSIITMFDMTMALIIIFSVFLPMTTAIYIIKMKENVTLKNKFKIIFDEYYYGLKMAIFFGSISVHMMFSILTYLFSIKQIFPSSRKEKPNWGTGCELKYLFKNYYDVFIFVTLLAALFAVNYIFENGNIYTLISPGILFSLHVFTPLYYSII